jgi:uncharacterized membrane protein YbhN (UPF0104 family)
MSVTNRILRPVRSVFSGNHLRQRRAEVASLVAIAVGLQVAAAVGLSYIAGWAKVDAVLGRFDPIWLGALAGALVVSFFGYVLAYRGVFTVEGGKELDRHTFLVVVVAGFGGFLAHGGGALDRFAMQGAGIDKRDTSARVSTLAGMEHGVLGLGGWACSLAIIAMGLHAPPADVTWTWAIVPIPGFAVAFWAAERYRSRFRGATGWRGGVGIFLDAVHYARRLFLDPKHYWPAPFGMAAFWAADSFALWCGLRAFGYSMDPAQLFVGFATGLLFTRRTGPLGGAGVLTLLIPLTLWYSGAPLAPCVVGFFAYQVFSLWLPLPFALAGLPTLRRLGDTAEHGSPPGGEAQESGEPALREVG